MAPRFVIGLAPGSSADGVDAALLQLDGVGLDLSVRLVQAVQQAYSRDLSALIQRVASTQPVQTRQLSLLHRLLGETCAAAARQVADRASMGLPQAQCIGCMGQCVWQETEGRFPSVLELGMAAVVAERTGVTTVSDFHGRDVAAGGQGGPLEALADFVLFRHAVEQRLLLHLGGVATITALPASQRVADMISFEAGPCNLLLNGLIQRLTNGREMHDAGGKHAVQGRCLEPVLERWQAHPYWAKRPPKRLAPALFLDDFVAPAGQLAGQYTLHDLLCTATHLVARGLVSALKRGVAVERRNGRILLSGGGARNGLLWHLLTQQLGGVTLERTDSVGVPAQARKAMAAGVLAALTVDGVPANLPAATGAAGGRLLGSLTPGTTANWGRCVAWMGQQAVPVGSR
jgi:anhydro-N-acetylmuramic acid kinase